MDRRAGLGVIFDTFKNTENAALHKDVAVVVNRDNSPNTIPGSGNVGGCDADFRYWEKRDDFSVANKSTAVISYKVCVDVDVCGVWV
jgi:hypothetical protein